MASMLYLSSSGLGDDRAVLAATTDKARALVVLNALDATSTSRQDVFNHEAAGLIALGYACQELDLRDHFGGPENLAAALAQAQLVWVAGGNTFVLARATAQAGFDAALALVRAEQHLTYGGYSAGACLAGPDLAGIHLMDDPAVIPDGYDVDASPVTLKLINERIVPHWKSKSPESAGASQAVTFLEKAHLKFRCLKDGQTYVVGGDLTNSDSQELALRMATMPHLHC
ncbi:MAG: Type 1 glutamine amidotransferase-like domain-containing protein [Actinomycetota bacterium]|nr:Type 1 glutamine amidotransferase-like domain-containing protein [Actinomycetota bacterium]MDP2288195.1 Type 1 glutamine amidotransferase-like domain-containing protein [Actinomycetota bacterium]